LPLAAIRKEFHLFLDALGRLESETPHLSVVKAAPGSLDWVAQDASYMSWMRQPEVGMLYVSGPPGSGVSVLASHIVKLVLDERGYREATILRFAFERYSVQARSAECALVSLCNQLLLARPWLFRLVRPLCNFILKQGLFTRKVLWALLRSLLQHAAEGTTYCVLSAVHECEGPVDDMMAGLGGLPLKTIVTSDDEYASQTRVWRDPSSSRHMEHRTMDLQALARAHVGRIARDKPLWAELDEEIVDALCRPPPALPLAVMHRLALLQWGDGRSTKAAMHERLAKVSSATLERPGRHLVRDEWVRSAFLWVAHATRPLTTTELAMAVALGELDAGGSRSKQLTTSEAQHRLLELASRDIVGDLLRKAPPFVQLVGDRVVPMHRELRASLSSDGFREPDYTMLKSCLKYLTWATSGDKADSLVDYASTSWPEHYQRISEHNKPGAGAKVRRFLSDCANLHYWARLYYERQRPVPDEPERPRSLLQALCHLGYNDMLNLTALDAHTDDVQLALDHAVRSEHADVVASLIKIGATSDRAVRLAAARGNNHLLRALLNVDATALARAGHGGYTALHHAACCGHDKSVELLLQRDARLLNARTDHGSSALCLAAKAGQALVVTTLVQFGADWAMEDSSGYDALHLAAQGGFSDIVNTLLHLGADPQKKGGPDGDTALHLAARFDHPLTLHNLLHFTTDTEVPNSRSYTPLHIAAEEGFLPILQALVGAAAKPPAAEDPCPTPLILAPTDTATPLQLASIRGHIEAVRILLRHRAYHDKANCTRALFVAAAGGWDDIVREIIAHGASPDVEDTAGNTLLHQAVKGGNVKVLLDMLDRQPAKIDNPNHDNATPLHLAADMGILAMVHHLLEHGANSSPQTFARETPLHLAARGGHRFVAQALQERMDTIDHKDRDGHTAFGLAVQGGHVAIVKDLLEARNKDDEFQFPFHTRAILEQDVVLQALLKSGGWDCNKTSKHHPQTPLQVAVNLGLPAAVKLLLDNGADVHATNSQDEPGRTPLYMAAERGVLSIVDLLLTHHADAAKANNRGNTPLFAASLAGHVDTVQRLLAENLPWDVVDHPNKQGWTALHAAATQDAKITQMLLKAGASPHSKTLKSESTPLARAAFNDSRIEVVRQLLDAEADANCEDVDGETAVHRAANGGSVEIMKLFIAARANLNVHRKDGCTPLHLAILFRESQVAELLLDQDSVKTNTTSDYDGSVLKSAVLAGFTDIVQRVLERSSNDGEIGEVPHPVLVAAVEQGDEFMVKLLLDHGAPVCVPGVPNRNALFPALCSSSSSVLSMVKHLVEADPNAMNDIDSKEDSVLRVAVEEDLFDVVEYLVDKDASTVREPPGKEPLVISVARAGSCQTLAALLKRSTCLLSVQDRFGRSPLAAAINAKNATVAENLVWHYGVSVNDEDHAGRTPLISSVLNLGAFVPILLKEKDIAIDSRDAEGKTALAHACFVNDKTSVSKLLDAKASTILVDARGRGPLYWACRMASMHVFERVQRVLREENPISYMSQHEAALCAAVASNKPTFVEMLLGPDDDDGLASPRPPDDGWTAMYTAHRYDLAWAKRRLGNGFSYDETWPIVPLPLTWSSSDKTVNLEVDPDTQWVKALGKSRLPTSLSICNEISLALSNLSIIFDTLTSLFLSWQVARWSLETNGPRILWRRSGPTIPCRQSMD
jgi:ankyrin repeat protein